MAQVLERITSFASITAIGDTTIWTPASGELGILCFFWVHALSLDESIVVKTDTVDFLQFTNDATNPGLIDPAGGPPKGEIIFDSIKNFDPTHIGQFKFPIEGAVDNSKPLKLNMLGGGTEEIIYSLAVVKEV